MIEKQQAFDLANAVLDKPHIDPDGDIAMLARQFLRAREEIDAMRAALEPFAKEARFYDPAEQDGKVLDDEHEVWGDCELTTGDLRRARAVLANFTVPGKPK